MLAYGGGGGGAALCTACHLCTRVIAQRPFGGGGGGLWDDWADQRQEQFE